MRALTLFLFTFATTPAWGGDHGNNPASRNMEELLVNSLLSVSNSKLDTALHEVNAILKVNPNFKLAQLVKGDLLLARSRPLNNFGNVPDKSGRMEDLRDEARARLRRIQEQPISSQVPGFLWQLNAQQRYAIVVDINKSTLYLYENVGGEPRYVADYYISSGKKGSDKLVEGDQKTPLGVYFVNDSMTKKQLTDFYGSGAFPIDYPNEWDRKHGRNGYGIWLHGTPSDTYSRPPRASNGCVVLANEDLDQLWKIIQVGVTPVIIANQMDWSDDQDKAERAELLNEIESWRTNWESRDTEAYLRHYSSDFSSNGVNFAAWAKQKKQVNAGKSWIKLDISNLSVFAYPNQPGLVVVNFEQDYTSSNLSNRMKKRQYWMKQGDGWKIVYEGAA